MARSSKLLKAATLHTNPTMRTRSAIIMTMDVTGKVSPPMKPTRKAVSSQERHEATSTEEIINQLQNINSTSESHWEVLIPLLKVNLARLCAFSKAGRISNYFTAWTTVTFDKKILSDIKDMKIELSEIPLRSSHRNAQTSFTSAETEIIELEIAKMLDKGIIEKVAHEPNEIVSNIFTRPKKDCTHRVILNLKEFNKYISHHFKMDSLTTIIKLVDKNCFMACIDPKDAYYSIPIRQSDRKYLKFQWNNTLYQYTCLPNGLSSGPRKFTKILKPPLASLHTKGHIISCHLDGFYLQGGNF